MLIDGEKWACDSCVKGHRVSNCNHHDRPLNHIAPKGRPVKQCEHCRDARKSKSHHAKCDCGNKRNKEKKQAEPKNESRSCSCHKGTPCVCSNKADPHDLRLETNLGRPTHAVKSKPKLASSSSETAITVFANGHHKPVHRNNNLAHTSGAPYKIPRPHTLHGASAFAAATRGNVGGNIFGGSADDLLLLNSNNRDRMNGSLSNAQISAHGLHMPNPARDMTNFDVEHLLANTSAPSETTTGQDMPAPTSNGMGWFDAALTSVAEAPGDFSTSPRFADFDWNIPSATTDFFSPSDLPLSSNPTFAEYTQPISHSGESCYQSAPGLTAPSSGTVSETGDASFPGDPDASGFWTDNVSYRDPNPYRMSSTSIYDGFSFSPSSVVDSKATGNSVFSFDAGASHQRNESVDTNSSMNMGHLQNVTGVQQVVEQKSAAMNEYSPQEATEPSIIIPVGLDDDANDNWYFPLNPDANAAEQSRDYSWLLDSA